MELIKKEQKQYKANLHCHSVLSDDKNTPEELKELYKSHGYSILSITDHEVPWDHSDLSDPDFLLLTGYECYIRTNPSAHYDVYAQEVHLNLFARDPHNETMICYNPNYLKYLLKFRPLEEIRRAGSERTREYSVEYIQEYIDTAIANGYIVAYNHPYWSMENSEQLLSYHGLFSMEMVNGGSFVSNRLEYNAALYDQLTRRGMRIAVHGGDDNHNRAPVGSVDCDSFRAFTYILSDDLSYDSVIHAMETGKMYCSTGPQIHSLSLEGRHLRVTCSPAEQVFLYTGSKTPSRLHGDRIERGETVTEAEFDVHPRAQWFRVTVFDRGGHSADTRAYFADELGW